MRNHRTLSEVTEDYLRVRPDEIDDYITVLFDEYTESGDAAALFSSLRIVSRVKGVSQIAEASDLGREEVEKDILEKSNPQFNSIIAIMKAMGYRLTPQKLLTSAHAPQ